MKERKIATALIYQKEDGAPKVVAKGTGEVAQRILEKAKEDGVTIYKDEELARLLVNLEIGDKIPESLYNVVAQVLVFVSDIDYKVKEKLK